MLSNDTDIETDPLTAVLETDVSNGALTLNADGSFAYTSNAGFTGTDTFTYKANDGTVSSDTAATVTILVFNVEINSPNNGDAFITSSDIPFTAVTIPAGCEPYIQWSSTGIPSEGTGAEFTTKFSSRGNYYRKIQLDFTPPTVSQTNLASFPANSVS